MMCCRTAAVDVADAARAIARLGGINGANLTVQTLENEDVAAYKKKCIV